MEDKETKKAKVVEFEELPDDIASDTYKGHILTDKGKNKVWVGKFNAVPDRFGVTEYYFSVDLYGRPKKLPIGEQEDVLAFAERNGVNHNYKVQIREHIITKAQNEKNNGKTTIVVDFFLFDNFTFSVPSNKKGTRNNKTNWTTFMERHMLEQDGYIKSI